MMTDVNTPAMPGLPAPVEQPTRGLRSIAGAFRRDQDGAAAVTLAVWIMPLLAMTGLALDSGVGMMSKHQLTEALDAATLAAGKSLDADEQLSYFISYLNANMSNDGGWSNLTYTLDREDEGNRLVANACIDVETTVMGMLGFSDIEVCARSVVHRATRGMEIILVMDNTWSMNSGGKMEAMQDAAHELVNSLFGNNETLDDLYIGLVPYVAAVNVGNSHTDWLTADFDNNDFYPEDWEGCVEARDASGRDMTDDPPSEELFTALLWESGVTNSNMNEWPPVKSEMYWGPYDSSGPNKACGQAITPLIQSQTQIHTAIDAMEPDFNGTTSHVGLAWGWRAISPRWRGLWTDSVDPANLPLDYGTDQMEKVVILLTDGVNFWSMGGTAKNAHGFIQDGRLGTTWNTNYAVDQMDYRLTQLCSSMKAQGIILYTILFQVNDDDTDAMYEACATDDDYYFNSPSNESLQLAFRQIASELANLRIAE